ncbi:MAG: ribulose-phosphate 3-epimerase [Bacteroidia bacterium]|nr:ribulose-phosphate 3-epimerase [Bacteroidia bacterium]
MHLVAPSILSADFSRLEKDILMVNRSSADWFHLDVMDGVFVPNISFGFPVIKAIQKLAQKPLDIHLMIVRPDRYIEEFHRHGAHILTLHYEAETHLHRSVQKIKSLGMKAGVALNPHNPVTLLFDILHEVDLVCLMSVNPGFGGQKFIPHTLQKIRQLHEFKQKHGLQFHIEVDGGVDTANFKGILAAGADVLVAGNTVFVSENPEQTIRQLKEI